MKTAATTMTTLTALLPLLATANPVLQGDVTSKYNLLKRAACTVPVDLGFDKQGTCVDTTKGNSCPNGLLVPGHCQGVKSVICCIPNDCFGAE